MSRPIASVLAVVMLLLAGCAGALPGGGDGGGETETGTVNFYISDEQNAIDDFEHLNATVTKVGFHRVNNSSEDGGTWVSRDINDTTVDLTQLQGKNATEIAAMELPNGTYNKVFVYVSEVDGTLKSGESPDVKLPSNRLHINQNFTVGADEQIDFVYDLSVVKTGNQDRYVLKPVVSQSGTDQEIKKTDARVGKEKGSSKGKDKQSSQAGRMEFYLSDEENAMGDFRYLNVTVTKVGFHKVDGEGGGEWVEYDVNDTSVDLTELQGANATKLMDRPIPNGTYDKVFVHVGEVDGTLETGEQVNVKLPSSKLHINKQFTVSAGENVQFVYDMSVFKAGKSGKYILKPVVSESGADKEIKEVKREEEKASPLNASFVGEVTPGENATVEVTYNGSAAENATVTYEDTTYRTNADGTATFPIPADAEEVEVKVTYEGEEVELERKLESTPTPTPTNSTTTTASG